MAAYLEARALSARVLLLGEAPSHRGCRFTGIAFCSEVELTQKRELVAQRALDLTSVNAVAKPMRERSAAIIWDELDRAGCAREVVLWNAFPWHPYLPASDEADGPSGPSSNRKPKRGGGGAGARSARRAAIELQPQVVDFRGRKSSRRRAARVGRCRVCRLHPPSGAGGRGALSRTIPAASRRTSVETPCWKNSKHPRCFSMPTSSRRTAFACAARWKPTASRCART